jgi:hypothetical protein
LLEGANGTTSEDQADQTPEWTPALEQTRRRRRNTRAQHRGDPGNISYLGNRGNNGRPRRRDDLSNICYLGSHGNNGEHRRRDNLGNICYPGSHHNKPKAFVTNIGSHHNKPKAFVTNIGIGTSSTSIGGITSQASLPPLGGIGLALGRWA